MEMQVLQPREPLLAGWDFPLRTVEGLDGSLAPGPQSKGWDVWDREWRGQGRAAGEQEELVWKRALCKHISVSITPPSYRSPGSVHPINTWDLSRKKSNKIQVPCQKS